MNSFKKLVVWQKAHALSLRVDELADRIVAKRPGLARQLIRAADSVGATIAEGRGRATDADFAHYVTMAIGSITEVENHLQKGFDSYVIPVADYESLTESAIEIRKMLVGLRKVLRGDARMPRTQPNAGPDSSGPNPPI